MDGKVVTGARYGIYAPYVVRNLSISGGICLIVGLLGTVYGLGQ